MNFFVLLIKQVAMEHMFLVLLIKQVAMEDVNQALTFICRLDTRKKL